MLVPLARFLCLPHRPVTSSIVLSPYFFVSLPVLVLRLILVLVREWYVSGTGRLHRYSGTTHVDTVLDWLHAALIAAHQGQPRQTILPRQPRATWATQVPLSRWGNPGEPPYHHPPHDLINSSPDLGAEGRSHDLRIRGWARYPRDISQAPAPPARARAPDAGPGQLRRGRARHGGRHARRRLRGLRRRDAVRGAPRRQDGGM